MSLWRHATGTLPFKKRKFCRISSAEGFGAEKFGLARRCSRYASIVRRFLVCSAVFQSLWSPIWRWINLKQKQKAGVSWLDASTHKRMYEAPVGGEL